MPEAIVKLKKTRLDSKHPWINKNEIIVKQASLEPGGAITLLDTKGKFVARGYCNLNSGIACRLLTFKDEPLDKDFFKTRITAALKRREELIKNTDAYRLIFSEADGLAGFVADVYNDTTVFQVLTAGADQLKKIFLQALAEIVAPKYIYERSDTRFAKLEGFSGFAGWHGPTGKNLIEIFEDLKDTRARFSVDIISGHKTGFYLDQRKSRQALKEIINPQKQMNVLDVFSYCGGFAVWAALFGAKKITAVDVKQDWLDLGRQNALLNKVEERIEFIKSDAFDFLKKSQKDDEKFDVIILDPPSFLQDKTALAAAIKGYRELNSLAFRLLGKGGVLATFSCSHNMKGELFSRIVRESAESTGKKITIVKRCHQDVDHPIIREIPQTEYLKGYFLRVE
jgi:23S rRNA (cytosine1962-C5)-methyltransferase